MKEKIVHKKDIDGSEPFRISIYIYPNQMKMINKMCRAKGVSKRVLFFEMIHMAIQDFKTGRYLS